MINQVINLLVPLKNIAILSISGLFNGMYSYNTTLGCVLFLEHIEAKIGSEKIYD